MNGITFNKDIYVVEGFDLVGKGAFIEKYMDKFMIYQADNNKAINDTNRWVADLSVLNFLEQMYKSRLAARLQPRVILDSSILSSQVNLRIFQNKMPDQNILKQFKEYKYFTEEVGHIYLKHKSIENARIIFDKYKSIPNPNEATKKSLDKFKTFDAYWLFYSSAEQMYARFYQDLGIMPRIFEIDIDSNDFTEVTED